MILKYEDLYGLAEELGQLLNSRLQLVFSPDILHFSLQFFSHDLRERWLLLDLTPAKPLVLSTSSTVLKRLKVKTPLYNFLNAHFLNSFLEKIEVAQKPNRTLRFHFAHDKKISVMTFKCYPHGQELKLEADGKLVVSPWRTFARRSAENDTIAFVEPSVSKSWEKNDLVFEMLLSQGAGLQREPQKSKLDPESYFLKIQKKLEKALTNIDATFENQKIKDAARVKELEALAIDLQQQPKVVGDELDQIFEEVRKLKRKSELTQERRQDLARQLEFLKTPEGQSKYASPPKKVPATKIGEGRDFSGTVVVMDRHFELWVGRTAWQNDDLVRLASPHDLWIHLRDYAGAHGVIRGPKKIEVPQALIEFSCRVVAVLSQSKKNPFQEGQPLDFIITPRKFIKKPKGAAPGRVIVERESVRRVAFREVKFEVV